MAATFTNGRVTLQTSLVFGHCVLAEQGPFPFDQLTLEEIDLVLGLIDHNPTCPAEYMDALRSCRQAFMQTCKWCGLHTATPCDYLPPNTCEHALNTTHRS